MVRLVHNLKELFKYRVLIQSLVGRELKARYRGTVLGFFWSFFNPLLMMLVYSVVFGLILPARDAAFHTPLLYSLYLFSGLLPWYWFLSSTMESASVLMANGNLIKKILFPAEVLPVVTVTANLVNFLFGLPILFLLMILFGGKFSFFLLFLPLVIIVQYIFCLGFALLISALTVHFRDIRDILSNLLTLWFFSTPVIYSLQLPTIQSSPTLRTLLSLNPMTHIIEGYHYALFYGQRLHWKRLGITFLVSLVVFWIGYSVFDRLRDSFPEEV
ncbi:MAG: ABC transporter permease [Candidatus Aminicenantes bacterium]|nr:ABC transporter permease [Candidatus Aminicenantes bacterium]